MALFDLQYQLPSREISFRTLRGTEGGGSGGQGMGGGSTACGTALNGYKIQHSDSRGNLGDFHNETLKVGTEEQA